MLYNAIHFTCSETIDNKNKMSGIDVQQLLDDKYPANDFTLGSCVAKTSKNVGQISIENKKITQKTVQVKTKPSEDKSKGMNETPELETNLVIKKPFVSENFLNSSKTNVSDMTREDLEALCLQLIVEGIADRSNLSEIKTKLKTMSSSMEELRKKTMMLTKQNSDLQIVLKAVQEEQKKKSDRPIVPPKITRSVGMQVTMSGKRKTPNQTPPNNINTSNVPNSAARQHQQKFNAQVPKPILVPATSNSPENNTRPNTTQVQNPTVSSFRKVKTSSPHLLSRAVTNSLPVNPVEKRTFSSIQSVAVDLSDDEPPSKEQVTDRNAPQPPVRLVAQNQLLPARVQNHDNGPIPHSLPRRVTKSPPVNPVEKRPFSCIQSVSVDHRDDEPPSKQQVTNKNAPQSPLRLVTQNQLLRAQNHDNGHSLHSLPRGVTNSPPVNSIEKRPFSSIQSVTVELSDNEPPSREQVTDRNAPPPPARLVVQQQLLSARAQNYDNRTRKVNMPINSQNQVIRPGQTIKLMSVPPGAGPRPSNAKPMFKIPSNGPVKIPRFSGNHIHPAPLPNIAKQHQPPNWKALPPAPDLNISKVESGIMISWGIQGYQEDSYEEIASYQLYSYQETSSPPSTLQWKKIGNVKALPLPMACTLTQFMSGYTYYFAVRAIDVRSRIGPFSLPILLLNK